MDKYVSVAEIRADVEWLQSQEGRDLDLREVLERIELLIPAADVAEVRHGRWVNPHWRNSDFACNCSACGVEAIHREYRWHERGIYPICPNCGARMYKEADHEVSE